MFSFCFLNIMHYYNRISEAGRAEDCLQAHPTMSCCVYVLDMIL